MPQKNMRRVMAAAVALATTLSVGSAAAEGGYIGILGGGAVYNHNATNLRELRTAGFTELIVWSVEVNKRGDLNLNGGFPLTANGKYIGDQTWPYFAHDLKKLKSGKVQRITLSIGSSNVGDFQHIKALVDSQGTGFKSILYRNFAAIAQALPIDAIDFDDENSYDRESTIKFALMLGRLGYRVTMNPFEKKGYWKSVVSQINSQMPGLVDAIHLQAYAGGEHNNPCEWDFGDVPVFPGLSNQTAAPPFSSPRQAKQRLADWRTQCGITGGWLWIFDQIAGTGLSGRYARAMTRGVNGTAARD